MTEMTPAPLPRRVAAIAAILALVLPPANLTIRAAGQAPAQPAAPAAPKPTSQPAGSKPPLAAVAAATAAQAPDGGWPRVYDLASGGSILVYQPQIATWDKQKHMTAFSAVSFRAKGAEKPALGTVKLIMGLPLFAPMVAVTWLAVRALYPRTPK